MTNLCKTTSQAKQAWLLVINFLKGECMCVCVWARPKSITGEGLFEVVQESLNHLGIQAIHVDNCRKLIG